MLTRSAIGLLRFSAWFLLLAGVLVTGLLWLGAGTLVAANPLTTGSGSLFVGLALSTILILGASFFLWALLYALAAITEDLAAIRQSLEGR
jgi:hypothetical protein